LLFRKSKQKDEEKYDNQQIKKRAHNPWEIRKEP